VAERVGLIDRSDRGPAFEARVLQVWVYIDDFAARASKHREDPTVGGLVRAACDVTMQDVWRVLDALALMTGRGRRTNANDGSISSAADIGFRAGVDELKVKVICHAVGELSGGLVRSLREDECSPPS